MTLEQKKERYLIIKAAQKKVNEEKALRYAQLKEKWSDKLWALWIGRALQKFQRMTAL